MKRWIHASSQNSIFDVTTTGMGYYNMFLNEEDLKHMQDSRNLTGEIRMMSPKEYFDACSRDILNGEYSVEDIKRQRESSLDSKGARLVDRYKSDMAAGDKFPLCFIDYAKPGQEGFHRMYAAGELFGWNTKFPVLVVTPYDYDLWEESKKWEKAEDFRRWKFKNVVSEAVDEISDWDKPVPADFERRFRRAIKESAKHLEKPHDIDVEFKIEDGSVFIYLTYFDGLELNPSSFDVRVFLEDMFDWKAEPEENSNDDFEVTDDDLEITKDDLEEGDLEIADYFFKRGEDL